MWISQWNQITHHCGPLLLIKLGHQRPRDQKLAVILVSDFFFKQRNSSKGQDCSFGRASDRKGQVQYWCRADPLLKARELPPESTSSADAVYCVLYSHCLQPHASTSVLTVKKSPTQSPTPLSAHTETLCTQVRMGSTALAAAVAVTRWGHPNFPQRGKWHINA